MKDARTLIYQWPSVADFAKSIGVPYQRARQWKDRNSIPSKYWHEVICAAEREGINGLTLEALFKMRLERATSHAA